MTSPSARCSSSSTKPHAPPAPFAPSSRAKRELGLPVAEDSGGITLERAPQVLAAGADLLAVVGESSARPIRQRVRGPTARFSARLDLRGGPGAARRDNAAFRTQHRNPCHDQPYRSPLPARPAQHPRWRQFALSAPSARWAARRASSRAPRCPGVGRGRQGIHRLRRLLGAGHRRPRHPAIVEAVREAALQGLSFGVHTESEVDMAELICAMLPSVETVPGEFRHRGHHERDPAGPRLHRPRRDREVRRLLPRPRRQPAGEGRLRPADLRQSAPRAACRRTSPSTPSCSTTTTCSRSRTCSRSAATRSPPSSSSRWPAT